MVHILVSLPDFFAAVLSYWISIMTGSIIAAGLLLYEHYRGKTITWGWCIAIALFSLFVSCTLAWVDEHDQMRRQIEDAQHREPEKEDERRFALANMIEGAITVLLQDAYEQRRNMGGTGPTNPYCSVQPLKVPPVLSQENWENLSLLRATDQRLIRDFVVMIVSYNHRIVGQANCSKDVGNAAIIELIDQGSMIKNNLEAWTKTLTQAG